MTENSFITGGQVIAKYLQTQDVEFVFTLTGHTLLGLYDALYDTDINLISVRHEQIAAHMADGYFRITHKPGVVITHVGPGILNAATGVATAALDSSALVVISGDVPSYYEGAGPHQELNYLVDMGQYLTYLPFVKRSFRVSHVENLERIIARAFSLSLSGRPGPVLVDVPMEKFSEKTDKHGYFKQKHFLNENRILPQEDKILEAVKLIEKSDKILILAGGGVRLSEASDELIKFAELLNAPVVTTMGGKGTFPEDHPLAFGYLGGWGNPVANKLSLESDLIIAIGTRFGEVNSSSWINGYTFDFSRTDLIRIDIDEREQNKNYPENIFLMGDVKATLNKINSILKNIKNIQKNSEWLKERRKELDNFFKEFMSVISDSKFIRPNYILRILQELLNDDPNISLVTDVGWSKNGIAQYMRVKKPENYITPGGLATMGFAPPASLGVKLGNPNLKVISVVGDGGITSTFSSLFTAKQYEIAVVFLIMNNFSFGTIQGLQKSNFGDRIIGTAFTGKSMDLYNPDFTKMADGIGIRGYYVERASDLKEVLKESLELNEPVLLNVPTELYPEVPISGHWSITDIYKGERKFMFDRK